jgi:hypothetical protein
MTALHALLAATLAVAGAAHAQTPNPSFALVGHIEELTLDDPSDALSAGNARVKGINVTLPKNLLITMPGQYLTLNDIFRGEKPGTAPALKPVRAQSGLALRDTTPPPRVPFEIHLTGNIVDGQYIAGLATIVQMELGTGAGFIRRIDHTKGELLVGAQRSAGESGAVATARDAAAARVRLNDPSGTFGQRNADKFPAGTDPMDERFQLDAQNAPVVATTGYPVCIPRVAPPANDAKCPLQNRAPAPNADRFTCGAEQAEASSPAHAACNPKLKAPLREGDYVTYAGMLVEEPGAPGKFFTAAHALGANLGIYTSPGKNPAYVFIEESLSGMLGVPFANLDQEETSRFMTVGFTTDPSRDVDVLLMDIAANSTQTARLLTTLTPQRAGQIGRVRITLPAKSNFLPITREVRYRIAGPAADPDLAEYTAPIGEYIYPENTRFGQAPSYPIPVPFENFCVLTRGGGRLETLGRTAGPPIGALFPLPLSGHPQPQPRADGIPTCP